MSVCGKRFGEGCPEMNYTGYGDAHQCERMSSHEGAHECRCGEPDATDHVYCHPCSEAGGADQPIYHAPPACAAQRRGSAAE